MAVIFEPLKAFRRLNNLTQSELGDFLNVSKSFVSQLETGRADLPYWMKQKLLENDRGWDTSPLLGNQTVTGDANAINNGHTQTISVNNGMIEALRESQAQTTTSQAQITKCQEQIDRLLTLIESFQNRP